MLGASRQGRARTRDHAHGFFATSNRYDHAGIRHGRTAGPGRRSLAWNGCFLRSSTVHAPSRVVHRIVCHLKRRCAQRKIVGPTFGARGASETNVQTCPAAGVLQPDAKEGTESPHELRKKRVLNRCLARKACLIQKHTLGETAGLDVPRRCCMNLVTVPRPGRTFTADVKCRSVSCRRHDIDISSIEPADEAESQVT